MPLSRGLDVDQRRLADDGDVLLDGAELEADVQLDRLLEQRRRCRRGLGV